MPDKKRYMAGYRAGYCAGYADGIARRNPAPDKIGNPAYNCGYDAGHEDGIYKEPPEYKDPEIYYLSIWAN